MIGARWLSFGLCSLLLAALVLPASAQPPASGKKARPRAVAGAKKQRSRAKRAPDSGETRRGQSKRAPKADSAGVDAEETPRKEAGEPRRDEHAPPPSAAQKAAQEAAQGASAEIVKEGDTSVKVMTFSGLDIEARLKSPQLLYFVGRVHAEFDRPKLPHRSFMPELDQSTQREPVR